MTGATVLIKQNNKVLMGKVRHDGYDMENIFVKFTLEEYAEPRDIWLAYLKERRSDSSQIYMESEIITKYDNGYYIDVLDDIILNSEESFNIILENVYNNIDDDCDGYLCGYSDY